MCCRLDDKLNIGLKATPCDVVAIQTISLALRLRKRRLKKGQYCKTDIFVAMGLIGTDDWKMVIRREQYVERRYEIINVT
jgi:hypothetical protein